MSNQDNHGSVVINIEFTWFIIARFLFIAGLRMTPVLLGWKLYEVTGSKLSIGILGLSEVIPAVLLALPAGVKVDRSNKQRLISICMGFIFFIDDGLIACNITMVHGRDQFTRENIITTNNTMADLWSCILYGAIRAYSSPAINAFLAQLVPQELW
jgi:hypothetical protein